MTLVDSNGQLSANTGGTGGGGTITGSGTTDLTINGTLSQVNADLATLEDTDGTATSGSPQSAYADLARKASAEESGLKKGASAPDGAAERALERLGGARGVVRAGSVAAALLAFLALIAAWRRERR